MIRRINHLERLHNKMTARYGAKDPLVQDIKAELDAATQAREAAIAAAGAATLHMSRAARWRAATSGCATQARA